MTQYNIREAKHQPFKLPTPAPMEHDSLIPQKTDYKIPLLTLDLIFGINVSIIICDITQTYYKAYGNNIITDTYIWGFAILSYRLLYPFYHFCILPKKPNRPKKIYYTTIALQSSLILACLFLASLDWIDALTPGKIPLYISICSFIAFIYIDCFTYLYEQEISEFYIHGEGSLGSAELEVYREGSNSDEEEINDGGKVEVGERGAGVGGGGGRGG